MIGRTAAARLTAGTVALTQRLRHRAVRWIAAGRRGDLTGWRAALGPLARGALIAAGLYAAARIIRAVPALLWILVPVWLVAAWRAAAPQPTEIQPQKATPARPPADPRRDLLRWLDQTIGDRPGIHLAELYPALRQLPGQETRDDASLRAVLTTLGVPVTRSLRIGPVAGRSGVRRTDVLALLSPAESEPGDNGGDAGQDGDSPPLSTAGERVETA